MRRILTGITFLLIVFLVISAVIGSQIGTAANDGNGIDLATVKRLDVQNLVSTTGTIQPERTSLLSFGVAGTVQEVLVNTGSLVSEGDVLALLDTASLELQQAAAEQSLAIAEANYERLTTPPSEAQIAQARSAVASTEAQLAATQNNRMIAPEQQAISCASVNVALKTLTDAQTAHADYIRNGVMMDPTFVADVKSPTADALDRAQTAWENADRQCQIAALSASDTGQLAAAEAAVSNARAALDGLMNGPSDPELRVSAAQVEQARIQLAQVALSLSNAVISAPFTGIISDAPLRVGQIISPGQSALTLIDPATLIIDADVDEIDVMRVVVGQVANVRIDALDDQVLRGTVARVAPTGRVTQGVITYSVRVELTGNVPEGIRSGMSAELDIIVGQQRGVLAVQTRAIQRDEGTEYVVLPGQDEEGQPLRVTVRSGQIVGDLTVITPEPADALNEGDTVLISSGQTLSGFGFGGGRP